MPARRSLSTAGPGRPSRSQCRPPLLPLLVLSILVSAAAASAQELQVSVGDGPDCEFSDLADAIAAVASQDADERVVKVQVRLIENVSLDIAVDQLTIRGGFQSCSDTEPSGAKSILEGGAGSVLRLSSPDPQTEARYRLENLEVGRGVAEGGGGIHITGPATVNTRNLLVIGNEAIRGGGIHIDATEGAAVELRTSATAINGNRTVPGADPDGAGIFCAGDGRILAGARTTLTGNRTVDDGEGGGVYLDGCEMEAAGDFAMELNRAQHGGGIAAVNDAEIRLSPNLQGVPRIRLNHAEERSEHGMGGGVYLNGASLDAFGARIEGNRALPESGDDGGHGGGIAVQDGVVFFNRTSSSCEEPCFSVSNNRASRGAAAFVTSGGIVVLRNTVIDSNVATHSIFEVTSEAGGVPNLDLRHSWLTRNVANRLFNLFATYSLDAAHLSIGGNLGLRQVIRASDSGVPAIPGEVRLKSSILFEPSTELLDAADSVVVDAECVLASEHFSSLGNGVLVGNPRFVDAQAGDLHLEDTSPAIDLCPRTFPFDTRDIDFDLSPVDHPLMPDVDTPSDAGADEVPFPLDLLFFDGFETGDTGAWTPVAG